MKRLILLLIILSLTFCKKAEPTFYYNFYDKSDSIIKKDKYILKINKIDGNEYLINIEGDNNYKQDVKMKIDSLGISRYCNNRFVLTHHFDSVENETFCYSAPPFIHKRVDWAMKRQYIVENTSYEVICYSENSGSSIYNSSYYLKGFGFICYYKYDVDKYILCDSIKNVDFDLKVLQQINQQLITDTTTFERYIFARAFPNFHRSKGSE
jgi:DNA-directed RNA polymerase subunit N (RpoN/RPB10)